MAITTSGTTLTFNDSTTQTTAPVNTNANVNSVTLTGGTGITISGATTTGAAAATVTNSGVTSAVAGTNVTVSGATGAVTINASAYPLTNGTVQASTSGTTIDFTGIPSWVKRITVMFNGVSTSGTSFVQVQIGSGSVSTSGYVNAASQTTTTQSNYATTGFVTVGTSASLNRWGHMVLTLVSGNIYVASHTLAYYDGSTAYTSTGGGVITLGGALDRVRVTTVNGTDTFDAGSVNILYE